MEHVTNKNSFHDSLKLKMHLYVRWVYSVTKTFPRDEIYGVISQFRRSSLSVILNYVEGYARRKGDNCKVYNNFLEISYGSLKESKYLIFFCMEENYINKQEYDKGVQMSEEIGKMLWSLIK